MTTADAQGPVETWVRGRFDCSMDGSDDVIAFAREQDAKLAQAEAERDKYKAESRSLNRERAAEVARADAAEQRAETAETERDALQGHRNLLYAAVEALLAAEAADSATIPSKVIQQALNALALTPAASDGGTT